MKNLSLLLLAFAFLFSCSEDEDSANPKADFEVTISGEAPNAQLAINNLSSDASSYEWTFSQGASISTSTDEAPANVTVDKAGELIVSLTAKKDSEENTMSDTLVIPGYSAIKTYSDINFDIDENGSNGRFFSFETESMYMDSEINADNGSMIHIGFDYIAHSAMKFASPDSDDFADINIPNAESTVVNNYESDIAISQTDFENMVDDRLIKDLTVTFDQDVFGQSILPNLVQFELSDGRIGLINAKSLESDYIVADIVIQKY